MKATINLNFFGDGARFAHVGIVVADHAFEYDYPIIKDKLQKVDVGFVNIHGIEVEFVRPLDESSPVYADLKRNKRLLHLAYYVSDLEIALGQGKKYGFSQITKIKPAPAFDDNPIVFTYHPVFGVIELIQCPED